MSTRARRSLVSFCLASAALLAVLLTPAGAAAGRGGKCQLSVQASASQVLAGETVTLSGVLSCPGEGASGEGAGAVTIYAHERGGASGLSEAATVTATAEGTYQFTTPPLTATTDFHVRAARSFGARVLVKVGGKATIAGTALKALTAEGRQQGAHRVAYTFTGTVSPVTTATRVAFQRGAAGGDGPWRTIAVTSVGPEGVYSFTHSFPRRAELDVRVLVRSGRSRVAVASEVLTYPAEAPTTGRSSVKTARHGS